MSARLRCFVFVFVCVFRYCVELACTPVSTTNEIRPAMIGIGRRVLHKSFIRVCCSQGVPTCAVQSLTFLISAPAYTSRDYLSCQPSSLPASRQFATASPDQYDPQGEMSAVTFHGPRAMKVSKKPKPRLQTPGVYMPNVKTSAIITADVFPSAMQHGTVRSTQSRCITGVVYRM